MSPLGNDDLKTRLASTTVIAHHPVCPVKDLLPIDLLQMMNQFLEQ